MKPAKKYTRALRELCVRAIVDGYASGQSDHDAVKIAKTILGLDAPKAAKPAPTEPAPTAADMRWAAHVLNEATAAKAREAKAAEDAASARLRQMQSDAKTTIDLGRGFRSDAEIGRARRILDVCNMQAPDDERLASMRRI